MSFRIRRTGLQIILREKKEYWICPPRTESSGFTCRLQDIESHNYFIFRLYIVSKAVKVYIVGKKKHKITIFSLFRWFSCLFSFCNQVWNTQDVGCASMSVLVLHSVELPHFSEAGLFRSYIDLYKFTLYNEIILLELKPLPKDLKAGSR